LGQGAGRAAHFVWGELVIPSGIGRIFIQIGWFFHPGWLVFHPNWLVFHPSWLVFHPNWLVFYRRRREPMRKGIKKGVPLYSTFVNLKSNTMKNTLQRYE